MVAVVTTLLEQQKQRRDAGDPRWRIPFRPDHGHELLDDIGKPAFPGYSAIGRLRGLAEIRGVMTAVASLRDLPIVSIGSAHHDSGAVQAICRWAILAGGSEHERHSGHQHGGFRGL